MYISLKCSGEQGRKYPYFLGGQFLPPLTDIQGHLEGNWGHLWNNIYTIFKNNKYTYLGWQDMSKCHTSVNNKTITDRLIYRFKVFS